VLTEQDITFFRTNGYLLPGKQLLDEERLARLEAIFNDHLADKGDKLSDELDTPHYRDERLLDFLLSDDVLNWIEPLIGPDIALWSSHFISKDPYTGRATPWHEDSAYWEGRFDRYDSIVTIWLALEGPSNRDNGCMRVIPGTHLDGGFSKDYVPTDMTEQTFHAEISTVAMRRTGYTMRYFPTSVKMLDVDINKGWKIWLARGKDIAGNDYANAPAGV
jgi:Phytanoyl-CoA dioxygenase (PhyH)